MTGPSDGTEGDADRVEGNPDRAEETPGRADEGPGRPELLAIGCGLGSIVFAVLAGVSLSYALAGPPELLVVPVGLAVASVACIVLKRRFQASTDPAIDGDAAGGSAGEPDDS